MKKILFLIGLVGICSALLAGCGEGGGIGGTGEAPKKATTPQQALKNMALAVQRGDGTSFADCFKATEQERKVLEPLGEFMSAAGELQKAVAETYGESAAEKMAGGQKGPDLYDQEWMDQLKIKINEAKAVVTDRGSEVFELVEKAGEWKILPGDMLEFGPGADVKGDTEQAVKVIQNMTKIMRDAKAKVGKGGYTAKKINDEMGAEMMKLMQSEMDFSPW